MESDSVISFGPYRLIPAARLLLRDGQAVVIGSRALDVLVALTEAAGEVLGQRELVARAWPSVAVGEGSLRVTIAELRKLLGDRQDGSRYIMNVTGRGYCFVAEVERSTARSQASRASFLAPEPPPAPKNRLPARLARMVGREDTVEALSILLAARRFVSVIGPGGMGKTTVAISVAHALLVDFGDAVYFIDLGAVTDPTLVPSTVATVLGVSLQAQDPLSNLLAILADRRLLLVLDNCEHVIDAAASLTERLYHEAPQTHVLATSRESLRVEGEYVHLWRR